ncbi:3D domain-containing protein [Domibacillus robiginosus]|uniref:3D domain-containing protein n=1 Tax=Domibacillus robiginosus TaxID=1071054 RepID=UPI00067D6D98|nr:3D domain-containing protein [Domibacillus robiginosus]
MKKMAMSFLAAMMIFSASAAQAAAATHTVQKGDTLYNISKRYSTSVDQVKKWNNLSSNTIKVGQKLSIGSTAAASSKPAPSSNTSNVKKEITVKSTAYTAYCSGCSGVTATGINLKKNPNAKVIAVDPKVIPLGTKVYVEGYGEAVAGDTGGAIKGNKIDVHMSTKQKAKNWGVRTVKVKILK